MGSLCCAAWFKYGLIVGDEAVYRVNALGLALHLGYVSCYAAYASKPARRSVVHPIKMNFCCCSTAELAAAAVEVAIFFSAFSSYSAAAAVVVVVSAAAVAAAISFTVGNSAAAAIAAAAIAAEASIIFTMLLLLSLQLLLPFTAAATFTIFFAHVASPTASAVVAEICPLPAVSVWTCVCNRFVAKISIGMSVAFFSFLAWLSFLRTGISYIKKPYEQNNHFFVFFLVDPASERSLSGLACAALSVCFAASSMDALVWYSPF